MKLKLKKLVNSKFFNILRYFMFWASIITIFISTGFFALSATGAKNEIYSGFFDGSFDLSWNIVFFSYVPLLIASLILASAVYMTKQKRSYYDLIKLFFIIELPILLVLFGKIVFSVYPTAILCLSIIILVACFWLWWNLLFPHKIKFLNKYSHLPLIANTILSGWIFLIFSFWIPFVMYLVLRYLLPEIFEGLWELVKHFPDLMKELWDLIISLPKDIISFFKKIPFVIGFILESFLLILSGFAFFVSIFYLIISPFFTFSILAYELYKTKFPKKKLMIIWGFSILIGGTWFFDIMEKQGSYFELQHLSSSLGITKDTDKITFDEYDLQNKVSNLNRLEKNIKDVYLAELKYPLDNKHGKNDIHDIVKDSYCYEIFYKYDGDDGKRWTGTDFSEELCNFVAESYEKLFFPLFYDGDFANDRQLAEKVYAFVFDGSLQKVTAEEIFKLKNRSILGAISWANNWRSTEAGVIYEYQKNVHLDEVNYDVDYNSDLGVYTNLATFTFQNNQRAEQEVFIEFSLPNENSVITDLKLGLNLELASQVAPKGAAKAVYEMSRERRIDPALLEQVGPRQYQLRVFPIPTASPWNETINEKTGKQKVQFEITAITQNDILQIAPQLKVRNLKVDNQTKTSYSVKDQNGEIINQGEISHSDLAKGKTLIKEGDKQVDKDRIKVGENTFVAFEKSAKQFNNGNLVFFLDNSASIDKDKMQKIYQELKNTCDGACDFYTFNFEVRELYTHNTLKFWGPSNTSALVKYLEKDDFRDKEIIIITDDSDFQIDLKEALDTNYQLTPRLANYQVLVLGDHLPAFKSDFTKLLTSVKNAEVILFHKNVDIAKVLIPSLKKERETIIWWEGKADGISIPNELIATVEQSLITEPKWREAVEDLWAYHQSRQIIAEITDEKTWMEVAKKQTEIAVKAHIVNQFNSLIALENEWQKERLEKLKNQEGEEKYKSDHDMGEIDDAVIFGSSAPEPQIYLIMIFFFSVGFLLVARKKF